MSQFFWKPESCSAELNSALRVVCKYYGESISENSGKTELVFQQVSSNVVKVTRNDEVCHIEAGSIPGFLRGVAHAFAGVESDESAPFETLGIMLDCSRNKVFSLNYLKGMLVKLALMGYNMAMLYTEDTYNIPEEPFFGYMRGAYTIDELKELDAFAKQLGIELIGCIQTLGHLAQILAYDDFRKIRDTASVMMVDEPETYKLIEKMILFWKEALSSRRLHIGMDETHDLGRGKFLDYYGYESGFELFNRHLGRVNQLCSDNGFKPIIWSDMYFRLGNKDLSYYDLNSKIPQEVRDKIPKNVQLCYWDYYNDNAEFYEKFIEMHRELGFNPIMGSGVWTWLRFWYDHEITKKAVIPCIQACRKTGLKELFFTMWGDNGGYCAYDSSLAGLEFAAALSYGHSPDETAFCSARFRALCGEDYELFTSLGKIYINTNQWETSIVTERIFWDDPLLGINWLHAKTSEKDLIGEYKQNLKELQSKLAGIETSPVVRLAEKQIKFIMLRLDFHESLLEAYRKGDTAALRSLAETAVPEILSALDEYALEFRADWLRCAKPFGLEVIQRRNAGLRERYCEIQRRIQEGSPLPELDAQLVSLASGKQTPNRMYSGSVIL